MAYLILADGTVFKGKSIGAQGEIIGETVFTTGMTGYLETLTDPSYYGQIVTQTFPLIGNYGVIPEDFESKKSWVRGYIVREICDKPSNFRCEYNLDSFLKNQNIIGICGIDTRALTKKLRESGVMNGMIISSDECPEITESLLSKIKSFKIKQAVETVSCSESNSDLKFNSIAKTWPETNHHIFHSDKKIKIVLWDFGAKYNIQRELEKRGADVVVVPYSYTADQIMALNPDGIMLSNGPGDPADNIGIIAEIKKLCEIASNGKLVIFGICLGHQMLALARGAKTSKLKYGHRGGNHPVKDMETGRVYISSQNHGYAVENDTLPSYAKLAFTNSNDGTCEGVTYTDIPAFSVQFHPEACGGPHDTNYLFDKFVKMCVRPLAAGVQ
ncbi:MAG: carbamoyl phosphate synthase small subunit [Treponema sp.]|nr:carbamoyl phosphate synthase small subunit [Treponema sp.]